MDSGGAVESISVIMTERQTKQARLSATQTSFKCKVENLPLLCVETIFKFTKTSKLTRLYSNDVPLPGAFWQFGLKAVMKKRLPLSIGRHPPHQHADDPAHRLDDDSSLRRKADVPSAVFDASGALIASIKVPEAFPDSPLCDLIGRASVALRVVGPEPGPAGGKIHTVNAEALLSSLPNIVELTLLHKHKGKNKCRLLTKPKHLLPRLQSFTSGFIHELPIQKMTSLQRLNIPEAAFQDVMQTANDNPDPVVRKRARRVLSGLRSLWIWQQGAVDVSHDTRQKMLSFVRVRCSHLTTLHLVVDNEFTLYLAAFRALTGLTTLGMDLPEPNLQGLNFSNDETISTVIDLRLTYDSRDSEVFKVASFFPAAKTIAFQAAYFHDETVPGAVLLDVASQFFSMRVLPQLVRLNCFGLGNFSSSSSLPQRLTQVSSSSQSQQLAQFVASPYLLPEAIDLSQVIFESLVREHGLLTAIYKAMQANSTTSLIMRGPLHRDALTDLQRHIDSSRENAQVTAWKDRDLGEQPGVSNVEEISPQTDVTIVGNKTSGILVGQKFTIRIVHQLTKRREISDLTLC